MAQMHQSAPPPPPPPSTQRIVKVRRDYNAWVGDETLEDYALRYTPSSFRRWSEFRVANTAIGAVSFLVLEAIGGSLVINYGFTNTVWAIAAVSVLIWLTSLPISYYAARHGVDMDLLTRGAGFGYIGSTVTSLLYASFTFIFFALEAAIMSLALQLYFQISIAIAYVISSLVVIPIVMFGITLINRLQSWTQPLWLVLFVLPYAAVLWRHPSLLREWTTFAGVSHDGRAFSLIAFGQASAVVFALIVQVGEQVDYLRFLPPLTAKNRRRWWIALLSAGPGWVIPGALKMLGGAFLAFVAIQHEIDLAHAAQPTQMYLVAYHLLFDPLGLAGWALPAMTLFVIVSQLKINVTNAYAGSLAWSNFFARLTHSHPGRVVWLVFNVLIALLLVEMGVFDAIGKVLSMYANVAIAWIGALFADLVVNKPLGVSPRDIEFKRAHLYDINPVGVGAMLIAAAVAMLAHGGAFGAIAQALSSFIAFGVAFACAPAIAIATRGRYYLARSAEPHLGNAVRRCAICENEFEPDDTAYCPAYGGTICSLCCSLDSRCNDRCKPHARFSAQLDRALHRLFPRATLGAASVRLIHYASLVVAMLMLLATVLYLIWSQSAASLAAAPGTPEWHVIANGYVTVFVALSLIGCIAAWWLVLERENRRVTQEESQHQTELLMHEIDAHQKTDAALKRARAAAEAANSAKSRYVTGLSHELRTPLNSILGYAQLLLQSKDDIPPARVNAIRTIHRSGEHLLALVDGLLDIARIEAGKLQLNVTRIALPEFLAQMTSMLRPQALEKALDFVVQPVGQLPATVKSDQKCVSQILTNLIGNAIRFTQTGSVTLRVGHALDTLTFEVIDTGPGIPPDEMERLFLPFERGETATAHDHGAGLGLTICRLLTHALGGSLDVDSKVGRGTRFVVKVYAPAVQTAAPARTELSDIHGYRGPRRTLLVVDDLPDQRGIVAQMLAPLGFAIAEAGSGPDALLWLGTHSAGAILMDTSMPDMDGYETSRLIREHRISTAPIMLLSANAFADDRERAIAIGCDDYLVKPVQVPVLLDKLAALLRIEWIMAGTANAGASAAVVSTAHDASSGAGVSSGVVAPRPGHRGDDGDAIDASPPATALPRSMHAQLKTLIGVGYVQGVIEALDAATARHPALAASLGALRERAERFQLKEFEHELDRLPLAADD
ncbi:ATP-binding protein [Burkholderia mayonis]|uniref:histidine kinase n=1 Tax=Burkholderia mayonis TaxID=1385591 RepID=A0A1B4FTI7_9BURK|nr:ATP-binding protein [Burkholderia mayonis]AOJ06983.1 hybrid sensor histidine kinase/response regulator [Burkholderia mayonis]KVE52662.1 hybrid sensor histidine kinase/response regulator [Burkholderia mayonis]